MSDNRKKYEVKEIEDLWRTYDRLVTHEAKGEKYSKTKYRNEHLEKYEGRTRGSYEAFMMNISTARDKKGLPIVKGYKPSMPNYNKYLDKLVDRRIELIVTNQQQARSAA